jgi:hypothetical protein
LPTIRGAGQSEGRCHQARPARALAQPGLRRHPDAPRRGGQSSAGGLDMLWRLRCFTRERPRPASDRTSRLRSTRPVGHSRSEVASTHSGLLDAPSHRPQSTTRCARWVVCRKILHFEKLTEN